jgi:hypothetical protein
LFADIAAPAPVVRAGLILTAARSAAVVLDANLVGIVISKIDSAAHLFRDTARQGDVDARSFHPVFEAAHTPHMSRVGQDTSRDMAESVHLPTEVIADVVADALDELAVHHRDLADVRRVDDQLPAVGHHRLELVHALGAGPQIVVHLRHVGEDLVERALLVDHVHLRRKLGRRIEGFLRSADKESCQIRASNHQAEAELFHGQESGGAVDDRAHRSLLVADDDGTLDQRPEPVERVDDLLARDAGEEVLVAAREARHLVGKGGADDHQKVVVEDLLVDGDVDVLVHPAAGDASQLVGGDSPDVA